ncbi:MAG: Gfo/Idh/MocA family oxidoreductase [Clostridia bacterium]|nr:Gfo/Idh/MocA family oxidoreductase [Clostridia bacterium]
MKKIRWGIVGPGTIANKFAVAIKNVDCAELVAVASRTEKGGMAFAEKYDIPKVFCGYENMAASDLVDAVYIATPHPFHISCAELFLNSGKHVLCEKPLCVNAHQAQLLKECSRKNGVFLMEAMWTRFLPAIIEAKNIVQRGDIGKILSLEADFCYAIEPCEDPKVFKNEMAGGSLLDVGVYGLHFASVFLGCDVEEIKALADTKDGVDIHTNVLLKYKEGAVANITSAIGVYKPENAYIYGSDGYIFIPQFYGATEFFVNKNGDTEHIVRECIGDGFEEEIIEACDCIRNGRLQSDVLPLDESIAVLEQMDAVRAQIGVKYPMDVIVK